ncbi:MAG TPA: Rieske 2Fe-2S domain-containing protein [Trueperaceae bacterium]|nr:Rieske 2Fe-2S domain-containing protein [Trueperaceae bacterium]
MSRGEDGAPPTDERRREVVKWLWRLPVVAAVGGGAYGLWRAVDVHFLKRRPDPTPEFTAAGPETVAPLASFAAAWDAVEFLLAATPAVAVRVPQPVPGGVSAGDVHLVAFSRICTHQMCLTTLNRDVNAINFGFNYGTTTPAITCPCHLSVFDPLRAGQAVSGPAVLPLPRARLEVADGDVVATGWERARS